MVSVDNWRLGKLGDEIDALEAGVSVNSEDTNCGSGYYVLKTSAVSRGTVDLREVKSVIPKDTNRLKCSLKANSILISRMNTPDLVGESGYIEWDNETIFLPDRIWQTILRKGSNLNCKWLSFVLNTEEQRKYLRNAATGTSNSMKNISKYQVLSMEIRFPKPDEQRAIADALSDADVYIDALEKLIAKKRAIKQGAMQELLTGKRRLPGFSGEWVERRIGSIGYTYSGLTGKRKENFGIGNARYITFLNVLLNTIIDTTILERVDVSECEKQNAVRCGDLFFNTSSETPEEVGMCAVLKTPLYNTFLNSFCFGFRLIDDAIDGLYLSYFFNSNEGRKIMTLLAQGATRYNLSKTYFNEMVLQLPSKEEQTAITEVFFDMDAEIEALTAKLNKAKNIKQGMMSELLTGRIRLIKEDAVNG